MAAVSIPPSPHAIGIMAGGRAPLSNLPNGGNSPFRPFTAPNKRLRSHSNVENEPAHEQSAPPKKKQVVERDKPLPCTPKKQIQPAITKRQDVAAERKVLLAKERQIVGRASKQENTEAEDRSLETIRQWQRYYRRVFPSYVFYFESVPEDSRRQCLRSIFALGAVSYRNLRETDQLANDMTQREDKFFSKDVTHVVTTRSIPSSNETSTSTDGTGPSSNNTPQRRTTQPRTINPSLLDKQASSRVTLPRMKYTWESLGQRLPTIAQDADPRRDVGKVDMLQKAKEMGTKIWQLEKLQRILFTIFEDGEPQPIHNTRSNVANAQVVRPSKQPDLSQMIKNEQLHGTGERELNLATTEFVPLKGPYIYIRCMNEKTKPIMVREYPKVQNRQDGEWPQFRSASIGKCPFVEEESSLRAVDRDTEKRLKEEERKRAKVETTSRSHTSYTSQMHPPSNTIRKKPLGEMTSAAFNKLQPTQQVQRLPPLPAADDATFSKASESRKEEGLASNIKGTFARAEPMASGMQASNVTSAIRSQMISSTAAGAPGAKAGTSKEIHGLQRKVFERNNGPTVGGMGQRFYGMMDLAAVARTSRSNPRVAKSKAQERLGQKHDLMNIIDVPTPSELEERDVQQRRKASRLSRNEKREAKPGYCENCREKFEDFEEVG